MRSGCPWNGFWDILDTFLRPCQTAKNGVFSTTTETIYNDFQTPITPNRSLGFWRECIIYGFPSPWCQGHINWFLPCEARLFMGMQTFHNKNVLESQETYRNVWWAKPNVVSLPRGSRENHFRTKHSVRTQTWSTPQLVTSDSTLSPNIERTMMGQSWEKQGTEQKNATMWECGERENITSWNSKTRTYPDDNPNAQGSILR